MSQSIVNSIMIDVDQQKGGTDKGATIEDQVIKGISIGGLFLSIVADGGGKVAPSQAAKLAIDTILAECKNKKGKAPIDLLRHSLYAANQAVYELSRGDDYVGVTIVAVKGDRLYVGQAGKLTRAYFVQNDPNASPILLQSDLQSYSCLGDQSDQPDIRVEQFKETIKHGERIIICSDGLFDPPEDRKNLNIKTEVIEKITKEIPLVGHYDDIRGSAKHLSSIAKGMDVTDDITVVVIGFGQKRKDFPKVAIFSLFGIAVLTIITIAVILLMPKTPIPPLDLGVAYLVTGNANLIDPKNNTLTQSGQYIAPGTTIQASQNSPVNIALETRTDTQSGNLSNIPGVNLYLAQKSIVNFRTINLAPDNMESQPTDPALLNQTQISLFDGQLLIVSNGNREYMILSYIQSGLEEIQILLNNDGRGILGVKKRNALLEVYCLQGACQIALPNGDFQSLTSPGKSVIDLNSSSMISKDQPIPDTEKNEWITICQNAQLPNVTQSESCNLSQ